MCTLCFAFLFSFAAQEPGKSEKSDFPATFDLLETKVRFESNGDSRKQVHAIVKIHSELGVRQFANLNFDFNRSFQSVEIPTVRITHAGGGTADILPSAITDNPNPAVVNFPAYHDVRVKSVRILGLAPGDTLDYRVITTTTHHPLAPDFWLDHSFDRTGVVSHELFDLPNDPKVQIHIDAAVPSSRKQTSERSAYSWDLQTLASQNAESRGSTVLEAKDFDIAVTTFESWNAFSGRLNSVLLEKQNDDPAIRKKSFSLAYAGTKYSADGLEKLYVFVSQKIATVDLPLGVTGFRPRSPKDILDSGYGTMEDKSVLLNALTAFTPDIASLALVRTDSNTQSAGLPRPSAFDHLLTVVFRGHFMRIWMDVSPGIAPFALVPAPLRGKPALLIRPAGASDLWKQIPPDLPFSSSQNVAIQAAIRGDGALTAKVHYTMRGDNELLLRLAFHQSPREKWPEVAQLLALSDGFRGKVTSATASDPYATHDPFTVEYEITQPKFVDWSKSPVRIPAILPLVGLPDPPSTKSSSVPPEPIELGTPLDVHTSVTLRLPPGTTIESPAGTNVDRDYATFTSTYRASGTTITASRHIHFISRELPPDRASDYNAFVHAVQNDQAQRFTLFAPTSKPSTSSTKSAPDLNKP